MTALVEVLSDYLFEAMHDPRLTKREQHTLETVSLALYAAHAGTDILTLEREALGDDAAMAKQQAAKVKREKASKRRAKTKAGGRRRISSRGAPTRRAA